MRRDASPADIGRVLAAIRELGFEGHPIPGRQRTTIGIVGNEGRIDSARVSRLPGVDDVIHVTRPFKQVSREWRPEPTLVRLGDGVTVGGTEVIVMAGPCSVESEGQILETAALVRDAGAAVLRAGAFKPRSSPYSFQGMGLPGLELLARAREATGLLIVTEVLDEESVAPVAELADMVQIGARNMQNTPLLRRVARVGKPILLKRGMAATIQELLLAAEYIVAEGNPDVVLCERGIRSFDPATRNLFDVSAIAVIHALSHLPIVADPSHGTGRRNLVVPMARAAVAAGADGLLVEVHPRPEQALSDGSQTLDGVEFRELMRDARAIAGAIGRCIAEPTGVRT